MTLLDLHNILGDEIKIVYGSEKMPRETQTKVLESAQTLSSLAKQMINNADVILRAQKLIADNKVPEDSTIGLIVDAGNANTGWVSA